MILFLRSDDITYHYADKNPHCELNNFFSPVNRLNEKQGRKKRNGLM